MQDCHLGVRQLASAVLFSLVLAPRAECQLHVPLIGCWPSDLHVGDTLVVVLPKPHPRELAITSPDDHWYRIVTSDSIGPYRSIIPQRAFAAMDTLRLPTHTLQAVPYLFGARDPQVIFSRSGTYTIDLGENLQGEGIPVYRCRVRYATLARPPETPPNQPLQRAGARGSRAEWLGS